MNRPQKILAAVVLVALVLPLVGDPKTISAPPLPDRDHHLFVGAEVLARSAGEFIPVRNIKGKHALIGERDPRYRPIRQMDGMSIRLSPKVSAVSATIEGFEANTIFVPTMDHLVDQAQMDLFIQNQTSMSEARRFQAETEIMEGGDESSGDAFSTVGGGGGEGAEGQLGQATDDLAALANMKEATDWEEGLIMGSDKDKGNTVKLTFMLSSDIEIADAYAVAVVRIWAEERLIDLTLFNHVGSVGAKPRRVTLDQRELPPGLEIKETEIYLFSRGEEIPTNLSPKRMQVTQTEAREFVKLSHLGNHRSGSVPARPVWALSPRALFAAGDPSQFQYPVEVELDADGMLMSIHHADKNVPDSVRAVVAAMAFLPEIKNGSPVASTITVNPADFFADIR